MTPGWLIDRLIRRQLMESQRHPFPDATGRVQVMLCGTGSPQWTAGVAQACAVVSVGDKIFVFDAGEGATTSMAAGHVPLDRIDRVFMTHYHSDHFNGLGALVNAGWIQGRSTPLEVAGPVGTAAIIDALNTAYGIDNGFRAADMPSLEKNRSAAAANPTEIEIPSDTRATRVYDKDGITIDARLVEHDPAKPALGYIIEYHEKKIFISGDTMVSPLNMPAMRDADLVVDRKSVV